MDENKFDIVEEYFRNRKTCSSINCQKVIFEPEQKREWFFDEGYWCYFRFLCDDRDYQLVRTQQKDFDNSCLLKDMSYEIKMLFAYFQLRGVITIGKELFTHYVNEFETAKKDNPNLSIEKFNYEKKLKEDEALEKSQKIANKILSGCLFFILGTIIAFGIFLLSIFFAPSAAAKSKYSQTFIQHFYICQNYTEATYNTAYNSRSSYEIKGYAPDGSGKCIYVETHEWLKGKNITTCYFNEKQLQHYYSAMINPDAQGSELVKGMPVVGNNEKVVFLKYFNNPEVCKTESIYY